MTTPYGNDDIQKIAQSITDKYYQSNIVLKGSPDYKDFRKMIYEALQAAHAKGRSEGLEEAAKVAETYDHYKKSCLSSGHDDRSCGYCDSINDGASFIAEAIRSLEKERPR